MGRRNACKEGLSGKPIVAMGANALEGEGLTGRHRSSGGSVCPGVGMSMLRWA